jgi:hypothetical protein
VASIDRASERKVTEEQAPGRLNPAPSRSFENWLGFVGASIDDAVRYGAVARKAASIRRGDGRGAEPAGAGEGAGGGVN